MQLTFNGGNFVMACHEKNARSGIAGSAQNAANQHASRFAAMALHAS
jgi:hypothetical protein